MVPPPGARCPPRAFERRSWPGSRARLSVPAGAPPAHVSASLAASPSHPHHWALHPGSQPRSHIVRTSQPARRTRTIGLRCAHRASRRVRTRAPAPVRTLPRRRRDRSTISRASRLHLPGLGSVSLPDPPAEFAGGGREGDGGRALPRRHNQENSNEPVANGHRPRRVGRGCRGPPEAGESLWLKSVAAVEGCRRCNVVLTHPRTPCSLRYT